MRKWKDNENNVIPKFFKNILIIFGLFGLTFLPIDVIIFHRIDFQDVFNLCLGLFAIWTGKYNGLYKIARAYAEWKLRRKDNKWRYYSR